MRLSFVMCQKNPCNSKSTFFSATYVVEMRTVSLHHSSGIGIADDMKDLEEEWIDMPILDNTTALEVGNMDSGILFDHDNGENSMSSVTTHAFTQRNKPAGAVSGLAEASAAIGGIPQTENDAAVAVSLHRGAADPVSTSAACQSQELPQPVGADFVGANP